MKLAARLGLLALSAAMVQPVLAQDAADPLASGFQNPPVEARPRVWWHWMNGNITEDGIEKDIAWMHRIGIGGLQNFDAALLTPQVVDKRLVYMTPEWKKAFRLAASLADRDGLELAIAGSPGWSETGGPWVSPEDAIKKLSWSETIVDGGRPLVAPLAAPPATTGPFQHIAAEGSLGLARDGAPPPSLYRDVAVLAVPVPVGEADMLPALRDGAGNAIDAGALIRDAEDKPANLGSGTKTQPPVLTIDYPDERVIRSATLLMKDWAPSFGDPHFSPVLEARTGAGWRPIATFELSAVPTTIAFAPVRARQFRIVFAPFSGRPRPALASPAPGAIVPGFLAPSTAPAAAKVAMLQLTGQARVDRSEAKAGFTLVNDYLGLKTTAAPSDAGAAPGAVVNLTGKMRADGTLDWTPPKGKWRILRLGWTLTGKTNHPAATEATGLEVDKLDGDAVARYLRHYLENYKDAAGSDLLGAHGVRAMIFDSTEIGAFNWTPRMIEQFKRLRGYDPTPWLPALTGTLIGSRAQSDAFLYDFRRTISELHATEHYATVARIAHDYGLKVYGEALEDQRPVLGDDMSMRRYTDVPMAALWTWTDANGPRPTLLGDMKGASSVGHLYGKNVVAAESMTSALAPWAYAPHDLRRVIDREFAYGINRPVIHTSVHQPLDDKKPGLSLMIFGQFFNRLETWAEMAKPWVDYMSRTAFLLQQGHNIADVAYFFGEDAPITAMTAYGPAPFLPRRYAYDYVNSDALLHDLKVDRGDLVAPSGARYRVLYLGPGASRMTLPTLRRIAALASDGATIVGQRPTDSPSLADDRAAFAALARRLWAGGPVTAIGKGRVVATTDVERALAGQRVLPDVDLPPDRAKDLLFVHRRLADGDLYFVVNTSDSPIKVDARFRVAGKAAEIWHADTGRTDAASYRQANGQTTVPLDLDAADSLFVVFRKPSSAPSRIVAARPLTPLTELTGPWSVSFQSGRGAPPSINLDRLTSLSEQREPGVRYFSGEATYTKQFSLPAGGLPKGALWLDLGAVGDIAEVRLNGRLVGSAWHAPFRVNLAGAVQPGVNLLEVKVADLWVNRLIGDAQPGAQKSTFTTIPTYRADAPLRPSGLIGPVRLLEEKP